MRALSAAPPRLGEWTHLTGVYDAAAGRVSLYVNGRLESTVAARSWAATGSLTIGRGQAGGAAEFWPGDVDEVRVYGRAVFAGEVADLIHSATTLVGHWKMDETEGLSAADSSGRSTLSHCDRRRVVDRRLARRRARPRRSHRPRPDG
ncbi:LamG domain-containing protein [Nonomuraea ferruginea]